VISCTFFNVLHASQEFAKQPKLKTLLGVLL
jgi:hypothetical protein